VRTKRNRPVWSQDFGFQVSSKKALWRPQAVQRWCDSIFAFKFHEPFEWYGDGKLNGALDEHGDDSLLKKAQSMRTSMINAGKANRTSSMHEAIKASASWESWTLRDDGADRRSVLSERWCKRAGNSYATLCAFLL